MYTMLGNVQFEENNGRVEGIHYRNPLGRGIVIASDPTLGEGGTWSTCMVRKTHSLFKFARFFFRYHFTNDMHLVPMDPSWR